MCLGYLIPFVSEILLSMRFLDLVLFYTRDFGFDKTELIRRTPFKNYAFWAQEVSCLFSDK